MEKCIILLRGWTAVGKSTTATKLEESLVDFCRHSSALVRIDLGLTQDKMDFSYNLNDKTFVEVVSKKTYSEMLNRAKISLETKKGVVLDATYNFFWQRKEVYDFCKENDVKIYVLNVTCKNEDEIKRRLNKRLESPTGFNEAPQWDVYLSTKELSEPVVDDKKKEEYKINIINYDTYENTISIDTNNEDEIFLKIKKVLLNV